MTSGEGRPHLSAEELNDAWPALSADERAEGFLMLRRQEANDFFLNLSPLGQAQVLLGLPEGERRLWMRVLAPDDAADSKRSPRTGAPICSRCSTSRLARRSAPSSPTQKTKPAGS